MKKISKVCPVCSTTYSVPFCHRERYKTCGYKCGGRYRLKPVIVNKCRTCEIEFINKHNKRRIGIYCSVKCSHEKQKTGEKFICTYCSKEFYLPVNLVKKRNKQPRKYCSRSCVIKHWNEQSIKRQMPQSYRINAWKVYEKKCYDCGLTDSRVLVIHHIDGNRKNGKLDNLVPVCHNCHCIRHIGMSGNHRMPSFRG